ncbi:MAG: hypothetical protein ABSA84_05460 [Gammaproteobacteria bacterium]|jgi:hypothetical protein
MKPNMDNPKKPDKSLIAEMLDIIEEFGLLYGLTLKRKREFITRVTKIAVSNYGNGAEKFLSKIGIKHNICWKCLELAKLDHTGLCINCACKP